MRKKKILIKNLRFTRRTMYCALAFVLVSITTMTLAYAALSTTLKITGTAEFKDASWGLKVEESNEMPEWFNTSFSEFNGNTVIYGDAKLLNKPTISGTSITNFNIQLTKPGDELDLLYRVTNTGNIPAVLSNFTWKEPTFTSSTNNQDDLELAYAYFSYDYEMFQKDVIEDDSYYIDIGNVLCPGATAEFYFFSWFDYNAPKVPSSKITVSDIEFQFFFTSGSKSLCNGSIPAEVENWN